MMSIGSEEWLALIQGAAAQLGVKVHRQQAEQFSVHAKWLLEWNRKVNLTAITDPREVAIKHFIDAIAPLEHIPSQGHLLDIGTGGGFPGLPLKIMRPKQTMTLIDSVRKKVNFVRHVIRQISLDEIEASHIRAEVLADTVSTEDKFDIIVCRALSDPLAAMELSTPLLASGGRIVLYQGPGSKNDADPDLRASIEIGKSVFKTSLVTYTLPFSNFTRRVFLIQNQDNL